MARTKGSKGISQEMINLIMRKHKDGEKAADIARHLRLKYITVWRIIGRGGGKTKQTGRPRLIGEREQRQLMREIRAKPDTYAAELRDSCQTMLIQEQDNEQEKTGETRFDR